MATTPSLWMLALPPLLGAGCESPPEVKRDGFLTHYSLLEERDGTPRPLWVNPNADFALYSGALLDPVTVWGNEQLTLAESTTAQLRALCGTVLADVRDELARRGVAIVTGPARGVLRVRLAITETAGAPELVATLQPAAGDTAVELSQETRDRVGPARLEAELSDSITGELLCAAARRLDGSDGGRGGPIEEVIAATAAELGNVVRNERKE